MTVLYSDIDNVVPSLQKALSNYDEGTIDVYETDDARMVALEDETVEERNLRGTEFDPVDDLVCSIYFEATELEWGSARLVLKFHESVVDSPLSVTPAGPDAIDPRQASDPRELGTMLHRALYPIAEEYDPIFSFKEVSAGSMAHGGHFTDFEYEYAIDGVSP